MSNNVDRRFLDFSLTEKLHDFIRNYDWQQGYLDVVRNNLPRDSEGRIIFNQCPEFASTWVTLSAAFEKEAAQIYERIGNLPAANVDINTCNVYSLQSLAQSVGVETMKVFDIDYPLEIKELIDTLSIPKTTVIEQGYALTDSSLNTLLATTETTVTGVMDGYLTGWVNTSGGPWIEGDALSARDYHVSGIYNTSQYSNVIGGVTSGYNVVDDDLYIQYIDDQVSATLEHFVNLDGIINEMYDKIYVSFEKSVRTILDTPDDDPDIIALKEQYGIPLAFFVNEELDKIIRGEASLVDYPTNQQDLINEEVERRKQFEKYGDQPNTFRRYRYEKERKVREYIRFIENLNILAKSSNVEQENEQFDLISGQSYNFFDFYDSDHPLSGLPLSGDMIENATYSIRNICLQISYQRENVRSMAQKHQMLGTERIMRTLISEYLYREFSSPESWRLHSFDEVLSGDLSVNDMTIRNNLVISSDFFNSISVVEYNDTTQYHNISAEISGYSEADLNTVADRYWEDATNITNSQHTSAEVRSFYDNIGLDDMTDIELSAFLAHIYNMGATSASINYGGIYRNVDSDLTGWVGNINLSGMHFKYLGEPSGTLPWTNITNSIHPSIAYIPWLYGLERIINQELILENIYTYTPRDYTEISAILPQRYDANGNVIDMWRKDNDMFTVYRDEYEYSYNLDETGTENEKIDYDGPFYFPALSAYLDSPATFESNFDNWYGHLEITEAEETKIKWQILNYISDIQNLANKKIYQFGIDKFGNQYTLFKDTKNYDDQGELWMKYKNHPLSFPVSDLNSEYHWQLDTESQMLKGDVFDEYSRKCYDFGFTTLESSNILWMHIGDSPSGNLNGSILMANISRNLESEKNPFVGQRLLGNLVEYDLDGVNEKHIGIYRTDGDSGATMVHVALQDFVPHSTKPNEYLAKFRFRAYDNTNGLKLKTKAAAAKYNIFDNPDNHNPWKLSKFSDVLTISYETVLPDIPDGVPSGLWTGSDGSGFYDPRYNDFKHGFHNGIGTISFAIIPETTFPQTYTTDNFIGYNDVTYQSVQAWEGWAGGEIDGEYIASGAVHNYNINDDNYVQTQFLGTSDPSTSARFDVNSVSFLCYNSNDEYFGLWAGGIYPSWADMDTAWEDTRAGSIFPSGWIYTQLSDDELSSYFRWNDTSIAFHEFTTPGETWNFGTKDENNNFYNVTVTYNGHGCHNMKVDFDDAASEFVTSGYSGTYWIRAGHYAEVLYMATSGMTFDMIDPLDMDNWTVSADVFVVNELDNGGSVTIHNNSADRIESTVNTSIIAKNGTQLTVTGNLSADFSVGDKITVGEGTSPLISDLLLESGDSLLVETGDRLLLEDR